MDRWPVWEKKVLQNLYITYTINNTELLRNDKFDRDRE